jgi:uroporphyrinogen-III synthase
LRVWITGSRPGADRHAEALKAHGHQPFVVPLLEIVPVRAPAPTGGYDVVVFLSEHAVRYAGDLGFCDDARVLAVGASTAAALETRGVAASYPAAAGSEGVLELLEGSAPRRVLIVAGEAGRKTLRDTLRSAGVEVREHLCYRRQPAAAAVPAPAGVDAILVASQDGFRHLARLWFDSGGSPDVDIVAASERVAGLAQALGFRRVHVASGAATSDWLAALDVLRGRH